MVMTAKTTPYFINGQDKIRPEHLARDAYIYMRQSTAGQVAHHQESQVNQARMAERAEALGWEQPRIQVIRSDLGLSGRDAQHRLGFQRILSEVSLGQVGIVFGYEVSRLARNNSDWYRLLEAAAIFDTLIADYDGIYDLHLFNDRLLLGLKGTMSEAELHLLQLRMTAGRKRQLERGVYRTYLPTGYIRLEDGTVLQDPDDAVRHTFELLFARFEAIGRCSGLLAYCRENNILLPRRQVSGPHKGQILWKKPRYGALYDILTNPTYTGTLVYGRKSVQYGTKTRLRKPMEAWDYVHHNAYPAYISWDTYLRNIAQLKNNDTRGLQVQRGAAGATRSGAALLQGLIFCGHCGERMSPIYKHAHRYTCQAANRRYGDPVCAILNADRIDEAVVAAFFEALQPAELDALAGVLDAQLAEREQIRQHWIERLQRATYEAHRAERQFQAVDPDNRLVAAELERRWEAALQHLEKTQTAYTVFDEQPAPNPLTPELREQFRRICQTLPQLWSQLSHQDQKALLRTLVANVIVTRPQPDQAIIKIVWVSGHFSIRQVQMRILQTRHLGNYSQLLERLHVLWQQGMTDEDIARNLTEEGFHSARLDHITVHVVYRLRLEQRWLHKSSPKVTTPSGYLKVNELAKRLDISEGWIYRQIRNHRIDTSIIWRHPKRGVIFIPDEPDILEYIQQLKKT